MNIFTPKSFLIKHKILEILVQHRDFNRANNIENDHFVSIKTILEKLRESNEVKVLDHLQILKDKEEIIQSGVIGTKSFCINKFGANAFTDKTYLRDGCKYRREIIYDILKICGALLVLVNFFQTVILEVHNKSRIESLEKQLEQIKNNISQESLLQSQIQEIASKPSQKDRESKEKELKESITVVSKIPNKKE